LYALPPPLDAKRAQMQFSLYKIAKTIAIYGRVCYNNYIVYSLTKEKDYEKNNDVTARLCDAVCIRKLQYAGAGRRGNHRARA
jgi:hypothetical protein